MYYPQVNGQFEDVNKSLETILQPMVNETKTIWYIMVYLALWEHRIVVKTATGFSPF